MTRLDEFDESPVEWGVYLESNDDGNWTPSIEGGMESFEEARKGWVGYSSLACLAPTLYRNPRIVRRSVSPWEECDE